MFVGGQCCAFRWVSPENKPPEQVGEMAARYSPTFPGAQPGKDLKRKLQGSPKQSFEVVVVTRKIFVVERLSDLLVPLCFVLLYSFFQILRFIC